MSDNLLEKLIKEAQDNEGESRLDNAIEVSMAIELISAELNEAITPQLQEALGIEYYLRVNKEATLSTELRTVDSKPMAKFYYRGVRFDIWYSAYDGIWSVWNPVSGLAHVKSAELTKYLLLELGKIKKAKALSICPKQMREIEGILNKSSALLNQVIAVEAWSKLGSEDESLRTNLSQAIKSVDAMIMSLELLKFR